MGRGMPQGDPLSPLLYNLALEPMLCRMRRKLRGVQVTWMEEAVDNSRTGELQEVIWKMGSFVDDIVVGIRDVEDETELLDILKEAESLLGMKVNRLKCEVLKLHGRSQ